MVKHLYFSALLGRRSALMLAALGFAMAGIALGVDLHDFLETPWYLWPWVPICSLYPLLLAIQYLMYWRTGRFPAFLLCFTVFGIIGYGIIAPVFYAAYMVENGFAWYELGNIFWVWLYASQAFLLWPYLQEVLKKLPLWQLFLVFIYFLIKDLLDRFSVTWSYVRYGTLSSLALDVVFVVLVSIHITLLAVFLRRVLHVREKIS